jgi:predicted metal-dependent TIM-barrel fold hydrolase
MKDEHKEALKIVLDLAEVGLQVQQGLDDVIGTEFNIPRTFPIPMEDAEEALEIINEYINSKVIANKTTNDSELCSAVQNK